MEKTREYYINKLKNASIKEHEKGILVPICITDREHIEIFNHRNQKN